MGTDVPDWTYGVTTATEASATPLGNSTATDIVQIGPGGEGFANFDDVIDIPLSIVRVYFWIFDTGAPTAGPIWLACTNKLGGQFCEFVIPGVADEYTLYQTEIDLGPQGQAVVSPAAVPYNLAWASVVSETTVGLAKMIVVFPPPSPYG